MNVKSRAHHYLGWVLLLCFASTHAKELERAFPITSEDLMVPALDAGYQLHLRNKRPSDVQRFTPDRIVLFVHGATFPATTGFDVDLPGGSWLAFVAARGFDAYALDVRGYGGSTRPKAMNEPPEANPPFADTNDAVRDISAAVDFILKRRGVQRLNVLGWSWGTSTTAKFSAENPAKVAKLVLFAPVWVMNQTRSYNGAYRSVTREAAYEQNAAGVPKQRMAEIYPAAWHDKWFAANLALDAAGAQQNPPVVRAPNGVLKDFAEFWSKGKPTYDAAAIRAPTLLIVGEWDTTTPPSMAQALFTKLTGAKERRLVMLSEGSHAMSLQKNRMRLIREVQYFLEEPSE